MVNQSFTKKAFGIEKLVILKGNFEINFEENEFGVVYLNISEESSSITSSLNKVAPSGGIRIAKKKANCSQHPCACGIGFRCGYISLEDGNDDELEKNIQNRKFEVLISIVSDKIMKLEFTNKIDWKSLE